MYYDNDPSHDTGFGDDYCPRPPNVIPADIHSLGSNVGPGSTSDGVHGLYSDPYIPIVSSPLLLDTLARGDRGHTVTCESIPLQLRGGSFVAHTGWCSHYPSVASHSPVLPLTAYPESMPSPASVNFNAPAPSPPWFSSLSPVDNTRSLPATGRFPSLWDFAQSHNSSSEPPIASDGFQSSHRSLSLADDLHTASSAQHLQNTGFTEYYSHSTIPEPAASTQTDHGAGLDSPTPTGYYDVNDDTDEHRHHPPPLSQHDSPLTFQRTNHRGTGPGRFSPPCTMIINKKGRCVPAWYCEYCEGGPYTWLKNLTDHIRKKHDPRHQLPEEAQLPPQDRLTSFDTLHSALRDCLHSAPVVAQEAANVHSIDKAYFYALESRSIDTMAFNYNTVQIISACN
ncbi:hypothetical protein C8Q76DRAFT_783602 [Earliella scabrosa]|nr:hypothetical protein C8Q76DRAFT_783602 [Earliella scabrosa]